jgi:hypothetical protein
MFGKCNGFVSKARVSACMYFLVTCYTCTNSLKMLNNVNMTMRAVARIAPGWLGLTIELLDVVALVVTASRKLNDNRFAFWKTSRFI